MTGNILNLFQKRFLLNASETSDLKWDVPITFTTSHEINFNNTATDLWLLASENETRIANVLHGGTGWIALNKQGIGNISKKNLVS